MADYAIMFIHAKMKGMDVGQSTGAGIAPLIGFRFLMKQLFRFFLIETGFNQTRITGATTSAPKRSPIHQVSHTSQNTLVGVGVKKIRDIVPIVALTAVPANETSAKPNTSVKRSNEVLNLISVLQENIVNILQTYYIENKTGRLLIGICHLSELLEISFH